MGRYFSLLFFEIFLVALLGIIVFKKDLSQKPFLLRTYSQENAIVPVAYPETKILGTEITKVPSLMPTPTIFLPTSQPTLSPAKSSYQILLFGDSMEETMGSSAQVLVSALKQRFPQTTFVVENNSLGAQNVEQAYSRLEKESGSDVLADIVIVGSFAYNPFVPHSVAKHTEYLTRVLQRFKQTGSAVYLLAEIAPEKNLFGSGTEGLNWDASWRYAQSTNVIALLENALRVATKLGVKVIDVYHDSIVSADKSGDIRYISTRDYLHPSALGHQFTAEKIATELILN